VSGSTASGRQKSRSSTVNSESLADVEQSALTLSRRFGVEDRGAAFAQQWRDALAPRPLSSSPRVLVAVSRQHGDLSDTLSVGPGTFYDELLERMGAVNIFSDARTRYPQVNLEEVMQRLPEAIIDLRADPPTERLTAVMREDWQQLAGVPALERGCYHLIGGDYVMLPGPRLPQLYQELREALEQCGF
jgi:iron complex transport system substrate-binding protein